MSRKEITSTLRTITGRSVPQGGFSEQFGSTGRTDATAWAILALKVSGANPDILESARSWLALSQHDDGRVCLSQGHPDVIWPTALAILAWNGSSPHRTCQDRAIYFLLKIKGISSAKGGGSITPMDLSLVGWPWVERTFSWVEPTALSILALKLSGYRTHERVHEATRLLVDRQLPSGGWNVGSTVVYGQESYPQLENTGIALSALAGETDRSQIERSLHYLKTKVALCRTPLSLGWSLLGLGAWKARPAEARRWVVECLSSQKKYGAYGTTMLSLMLLAHEAKGGFLEVIA
jgi:hypothetical protein